MSSRIFRGMLKRSGAKTMRDFKRLPVRMNPKAMRLALILAALAYIGACAVDWIK